MTPLPHLQAIAASMQALARVDPDQAHPVVIGVRVAQLDSVFRDHEWGDYADQALVIWQDCRVPLLGQLVVEEVK